PSEDLQPCSCPVVPPSPEGVGPMLGSGRGGPVSARVLTSPVSTSPEVPSSRRPVVPPSRRPAVPPSRRPVVPPSRGIWRPWAGRRGARAAARRRGILLPMTMTPHPIALADGRTLEVLVAGPEGAPLLVNLPGTPSGHDLAVGVQGAAA